MIKSMLIILLIAVLIFIGAILHVSRKRREIKEPLRHSEIKWLIMLLAGLMSISIDPVDSRAEEKNPDKSEKVKDSPVFTQIRGILGVGLQSDFIKNNQENAVQKARNELEPLLQKVVQDGKLSPQGAERILDLYEECIGHGLRSLATCYEPMPPTWVGWETGGGVRQKACTRLELLDKLAREGKLDPKTADSNRQEIAEDLQYLEALKAYLVKKEDPQLREQILNYGKEVIKPDAATLEAASFILDLFR